MPALGRSLSFTRRSRSSAAGEQGGQPEIRVSTAGSGAGGIRRSLSFTRRNSNADLPRNWKRQTDADGNEVFFNTVTKETAHDRPKPLPRHWREAVDKSSGSIYYWHVRTRAVRWERPIDEEAESGKAEVPEARDGLRDDEEAPPPPSGPKQQMKRVLSFGRRRKSSSAGSTTGSGGSGGGSGGGGGGVGGPTCSELDIRPKLNIQDFVFSHRSGETLVKRPGEVGGQQFIIEDCTDCDIFVLDWSATITVDRCTQQGQNRRLGGAMDGHRGLL